MNARVLVSIARAAAAALLLVGCLPGDTRPPPAVIHFMVEPSAADIEGVTTADGWHIVFEKLLVGLGDTGLFEEPLCNRYADGGYERLFDFTVPGKQVLSDVYGLGTCTPFFSLMPPASDAPLGQGVTAQDLAFMRVRDVDGDAANLGGIKSAYLRGRATRDAVTKTFEWTFRIGFGGIGTCASLKDPGSVVPANKLHLRSGDELSLSLEVHGEELFRERPSAESPLLFDAIAGADADGDQAITLEELFLVPGPAPEADAGPSAEGDAEPPSIGQTLYFSHLWRMVRLDDSGACLPVDP
jgi:hypothetical protein